MVLAMEAYENWSKVTNMPRPRITSWQDYTLSRALYPAFQYASNGAALFPENTWMLRLKAQYAKQLGDTECWGSL